jgi:hypothetical protein
MWIIMATSLTAMAVVVCYLIIYLIVERNNPSNKIQWNPIFQVDLTPVKMPAPGNRSTRRVQKLDDNILTTHNLNMNVSRTIDKGQLGLEIINNSPLTISCILMSAETSLQEYEPPRSKFPKPPTTILSGGRIRLTDEAFDMNKTPCGSLLGSIDMVIKYGKPGRERYELKVSGAVNVVMEHYGMVSSVRILDTMQSITKE